MRKLVSGIVAAMLLAALSGIALADNPAGSAKGVNPAADAAAGGANRTLVVGSDVFIGDVVETGPKGQVQILFADDTELVVGPRSTLKIEDYLLRNNGSAGKLAVDMLSGAFRFVTGDSAKNRYQIDTPTGTIGVRGTGFDVFVGADGATSILLYHGAVQFCSLSKVCQVISNYCDVGHYDHSDAQVLGDSRLSRGDLRNTLKGEFIYAMNQSPLLRQFWIATAYDCLHNAPTVPPQPPRQSDQPPPPPQPR
jgi:hypothetical protein